MSSWIWGSGMFFLSFPSWDQFAHCILDWPQGHSDPPASDPKCWLPPHTLTNGPTLIYLLVGGLFWFALEYNKISDEESILAKSWCPPGSLGQAPSLVLSYRRLPLLLMLHWLLQPPAWALNTHMGKVKQRCESHRVSGHPSIRHEVPSSLIKNPFSSGYKKL